MAKKITILIVLILVLIGSAFYIITNKDGDTPLEDNTSSRGGLFQNFFPFGDSSNEEDGVRGPSPTSQFNNNAGLLSNTNGDLVLQQLSNIPTAAYIATSTENGLVIRYIERETGNVFDVSLETLTTERITNTTLVGVVDGYWHMNAETGVFRYYDDDTNTTKSYFSSIVATTTDEFSKLEGEYLVDGIYEISQNNNKDAIVYLTGNGLSADFHVLNFEEEDATKLFSSPFSEWKIQWLDNSELIAVPKASYATEGSVYKVNLQTGIFKKVFGGARGFTAISNNDGTIFLYSKTENNSFSSHLYRESFNSSLRLSFDTFAQKCVWAELRSSFLCAAPTIVRDARLPDAWYQGVISFTDAIWEVDVETGIESMLIEPSQIVSQEIDAIDLQLTPDEKYLLFRNKNNSTLWSLSLPEIVDVEIDSEESDEVSS